ncbi:MAG: monovalent cation/H+ antiporter subunit D family protein [Hyphomicrobiaceae bacterium]|nr:monovalent cation/H+ antiporter subunit D family protein [Hyphomicrobiaceae bacterium]
MSSLQEHLPILQILVPLFGAILTAFTRSGTTAWAIAAVSSAISPFISAALLIKVTTTGQPISYVMGPWAAPWGIEYRVDLLNGFILLLVSLIGLVSIPYARKSVAQEIDSHKQSWFYTMYLLCLTGLLGICITGDAFNAFVFLEVSSLSTYTLIALGRQRRALVSAYQYLVMGTIGATFYIIGVGLIYIVTGTLNFVDLAARIGPAMPELSRPIIAALAFMTVGISLKLALFPLHVWLPNAYAFAPSFATAFLAGTATKVAIYLLLRIFYTFFSNAIPFYSLPISEFLLVLSLAAMFVASFTAIFEENAKRMLAYSSVAQIGYITLGIALANKIGLAGSLVHMFNHAIMKTALFFALGAMVYRTGVARMSSLSGIGRKMPITTAAFVVAGLGLIGVPGTAGFISKWYLAMGAIEHGWIWLVFLIVLSSLLAVVYVGRFIEIAYFREPSSDIADSHEPPLSMLAPLIALAAATIYLGFDTRLTGGVARQIADFLLSGVVLGGTQ